MSEVATLADTRLLDNIVWHALSGAQAQFSRGTHEARRYARGFSAFIAFPDPERPRFSALDPYCEPGEHFHCGAWKGVAPQGWRLEADASAHQFVWDAPAPAADDSLRAVRLGPADVPAMLELVALTRPGPFAERTIELGEYYGVFEGRRLIAMAGERMAAGSLREISGVCTHPEFRGRGFARRLVHRLVRIQRQRGQLPFLHVMHGNANARAIYARMGFRDLQQIVVRVLTRC